ncbi:MAG: hypothetical protein WBD87_07115 [Candidatus Acidiferrales bacterium]
MIRRSAHCIAAIAFVVALCFTGTASAQAQDYKAAVSSVPVPAEIAAPVRAVLSPASLSITGPSGPFCEIWLRTDIPAAAQPSTALGVTYGQLVDGEIVGAIHFDGPVKDFRNQPVKTGTYVMRYGLQPVDGNHQGVSDYRDFFLLTPPDQDTSAANLADNAMYMLSRKATTSGHPSVWSLVPTDSAPTLLPGTKQDTSEDLWTVYFTAVIGPSPMTIGLVISGHAATP